MATDRYPLTRTQIKESLDKATLRITLASTIVAVIAAFAAVWTAYEARQTRIDDERPFIAVDVAPLPNPPNTNFIEHYTRATVVALGKSPAKKLEIQCFIVPNPVNNQNVWPIPADKDVENNYSIPFMFPGRSQALESCPYAGERYKSIYDNEYIQLGLVTYESETHTKYQTPFCVRMGFDSSGVLGHELCEKSFGLPDLK